MNNKLLYSAMLLALTGTNEAMAQKVTAPDFPAVQLKLDGTDTVYVYNVKAQMWLNAGNAYGTQTSLKTTGMGIVFVPNTSAPGTYQLVNNSNGSYGRKIFYNAKDDNGGTSYVDYASQGIEKCNWEVHLKADGKFELRADSVKFGEETEGTLAGYNPNDAEKTETSDGYFRPVLNMSNDDAADYGVEWLAASPADYPIFNYRLNSLMPAINDAIDAGADVTKSIEVYNNADATLDEMKEACQYALDMKRNKDMEGASSKDVKDITSYITNANCNSMTGWTKNTEVYDNDGNVGSGGHGFNWNTHTTTYTTESDGHTTDTFIERWVHRNSIYDCYDSSKSEANAGHLSDGSVSQTLTNLPAGGYKLTCYANANQQGMQENDPTYRPEGAYFFATTNGVEKKVKVATAVQSPEKYELYVTVEEGADLTFGMKLENTTANWVFIDDVTLSYYGTDALVMSVEAAKTRAEEKYEAVRGYSICEDYINDVESVYDSISDLDAASCTQADVDKLLEDLDNAVAAAEKNKTLYETLVSLGDDLNELTSNDKYESDDLQAAMDDCGNGESYEDLCGSFALKSEALQTYIEKLQKLMESTRKSAIKVDADVTSELLTNPDFAAISGWTNKGGTFNSTWQNIEAYQTTFDVYQEVTDIPNGVYEISAQAMHRIASNSVVSELYPEDENEITAYIYGNDYTAKFASTYSYGMDEQKVTTGNADYQYGDKWYPNSMQGFAEACAESEDAYKTTVYALVTDGKLRIGVKEEARPSGRSGDWAIWDNFKVVYKGESSEALNLCTGALLSDAKALENSKMNAGVCADLIAATSAVESGATIDNIAALNEAIIAAKASVKVYEPLVSAISDVESRYESNESETVTTDAAKAIYNAGKKAAEDACDNGTVDNNEEAINAAIKELNASFNKYLINDVIAAAQDNESVDISKVVSNYDFATMDKTGWTYSTKNGNPGFQASNEVKAVEFYNCQVFDMSQEIVGLPAGKYEISARAYYRKGTPISTDDAVNTYVYATSDATKSEKKQQAIQPIWAGPVAEADLTEIGVMSTTSGLTSYEEAYLPNNMVMGQKFLSSELVGYKYDSDVVTFDYDGTSPFIIGLSNDAQVSNDWTFIKSVSVKYIKGSVADGIDNVIDSENAGDVVSTEIFDASGSKTNVLKKGINIVKSIMSNGLVKVKKVIVK